MEKRSDRYNQSQDVPQINSRVKKNKYLYDELNSKIGYEEISVANTDTQIDLSSLNLEKPNREDYQKIKEYKTLLKDNSVDKVEIEKKEIKPKVFDINKVLEEAKKNRREEDELEKKRNLKEEDYNVLSSLNKKYLHKKDFSEKDSDELKELIDTITSKTLVNEIKDEEEKELLSELLATTIDVKLEKELSTAEINSLYENKESSVSDENADNSFYTHSMELNKDDLIDEPEEDNENNDISERKNNGFKIFTIIIILIILIIVVTYFLLKHFGISFS